MKKVILFALVAFSAVIMVSSCTKNDLNKPAAVNSLSAAPEQDGAVARVNPAPGNYKVSLYIDDNDTSTATFKGYVFTFKTGGVLLAAVGGKTYTGRWESKDGGTELKIDIEGTEALHDISKGWDVIKMTDVVIRLSDLDEVTSEVTKLTFKKL